MDNWVRHVRRLLEEVAQSTRITHEAMDKVLGVAPSVRRLIFRRGLPVGRRNERFHDLSNWKGRRWSEIVRPRASNGYFSHLELWSFHWRSGSILRAERFDKLGEALGVMIQKYLSVSLCCKSRIFERKREGIFDGIFILLEILKLKFEVPIVLRMLFSKVEGVFEVAGGPQGCHGCDYVKLRCDLTLPWTKTRG